eukprot:3936623-Rhodomonas_salina.2
MAIWQSDLRVLVRGSRGGSRGDVRLEGQNEEGSSTSSLLSIVRISLISSSRFFAASSSFCSLSFSAASFFRPSSASFSSSSSVGSTLGRGLDLYSRKASTKQNTSAAATLAPTITATLEFATTQNNTPSLRSFRYPLSQSQSSSDALPGSEELALGQRMMLSPPRQKKPLTHTMHPCAAE